jgi:hypothetical protein
VQGPKRAAAEASVAAVPATAAAGLCSPGGSLEDLTLLFVLTLTRQMTNRSAGPSGHVPLKNISGEVCCQLLFFGIVAPAAAVASAAAPQSERRFATLET